MPTAVGKRATNNNKARNDEKDMQTNKIKALKQKEQVFRRWAPEEAQLSQPDPKIFGLLHQSSLFGLGQPETPIYNWQPWTGTWKA